MRMASQSDEFSEKEEEESNSGKLKKKVFLYWDLLFDTDFADPDFGDKGGFGKRGKRQLK